jgi:hypothetical protein
MYQHFGYLEEVEIRLVATRSMRLPVCWHDTEQNGGETERREGDQIVV